MSAITDDRIAATRAEVTAWFFEDYLPRWVAAATGAEGPEFIHEYWGTPLHVTGLEQSFWCLDDASVLAFLEFNYAPLRDRATATPSSRTAGSSSTARSEPRSRSSGRGAARTTSRSSAGPPTSRWPDPSTGGVWSVFRRRPRTRAASTRSGPATATEVTDV